MNIESARYATRSLGGIRFASKVEIQPSGVELSGVVEDRMYRPMFIFKDLGVFFQCMFDSDLRFGVDCLNAISIYYFLRIIDEVKSRGIDIMTIVNWTSKMVLFGRNSQLIGRDGSVIEFARGSSIHYHGISTDTVMGSGYKLERVRVNGFLAIDDVLAIQIPRSVRIGGANGDTQNLVVFPDELITRDGRSLQTYGHLNGRREASFDEMMRMMLDYASTRGYYPGEFDDLGGIRVTGMRYDVEAAARYLISKL